MSPLYLRQLLVIHEPYRALRSSGGGPLLHRPQVRLRMSDADFGVVAPKVWNELPSEVRCASTLGEFKTRQKTF
jgi:hypothetical protein